MSNDLNIWKVSQSPRFFTDQENEDLFDRQCVCVHPDTSAKGKSSISQGEDFCNVKRGDYFYLCYGNNGIRLFGMFIGESQPCRLQGKEDWLEQKYDLLYESKSNQKYQGSGGWWTPKDNSTFTKVGNNENFEKWILLPFFSRTINEIKYFNKMKTYAPLLLNNHNLILTGAPGTGKTYLAKKIAQQLIFGEVKEHMTNEEQKKYDEQCGFVQFHPSYDYTDFVEGLRPVQDNNDNVGFELKDGIFKIFCVKALKNYLNSKKSTKTLQRQLLIHSLIDAFIQDAIYGDTKYQTATKNSFSIIGDSDKRIKIFIDLQIKNQEISIPKKDLIKLLEHEKKDLALKDIKDICGRKVRIQSDSYVFALYNELLKRFENEKNNINSQTSEKLKNFVFIIDEINRGEISKIFGELFFSIDPGYRGTVGKVRTQYANMQTDEPNDFDDALEITDSENYGHFFVPENVYIIGTMNDIDRSVESMDFAFRRRFAFKEVKSDENLGMLDNLVWKDDAIKRMKALNSEIEKIEGLSSAYHIGPAYFLKLENYNGDFAQLWENHLEGLLREYLRGMQGVEELIEKLKEAYNK